MNQITKKALLELPKRKDWRSSEMYDEILLVPTRKKYDSGWMLIAIVGVRKGVAIEIAAQCDDVNWAGGPEEAYEFRTDCYYPAGILRFWSRNYLYRVGAGLPSTTIRLVKKIE